MNTAAVTRIANTTSFAISRAGAIAAVAANRRLHLVLPVTVRLALLVGGALTIGTGAATTMGSGLGPGPFDVLVTGIAGRTGLSFAASLWLLAILLGLAATALGKRPGLGTVLAPMIIGPTIDLLTGPLGNLSRDVVESVFGPGRPVAFDRPGALLLLAIIHLTGVAIIGVGAGAMIASGLGAGTGDLLADATSSRLGRSMPMVRTALEIGFVAVGVILGGAAGIGTVLVALTIGPAVRFGHGRVEAVIGRGSDSLLTVAGPETVVGRGLLHLRNAR